MNSLAGSSLEAGKFCIRSGKQSDIFSTLPNPLLTDLEIIASSTAAKNGFDLCSVQLLTHLVPVTMQVQIRRKSGEGVSLDDCASFSEPMGEALEKSNLIKDAYVLEVSSPGIGNILNTDKDFSTFKGFPIEICFQDEKDHEAQLAGLLKQRSEEHVHLNIKGRLKLIPRDKVIFVRLTSPAG